MFVFRLETKDYFALCTFIFLPIHCASALFMLIIPNMVHSVHIAERKRPNTKQATLMAACYSVQLLTFV